MSEALLKEDFPTFDLRIIYTPKAANSTAETPEEPEPETASALDKELISKLTEKGLEENIIKKLLKLGEPFKRSCRVLGFNTELGQDKILYLAKLVIIHSNHYFNKFIK